MELDRYTLLGFFAVVVVPATLVGGTVYALTKEPSKPKVIEAPAVVVSTAPAAEAPIVVERAEVKPVVAASAPVVPGKWSYHTNVDKMDGTKWTNAVLKSTTTEAFNEWPYKKDARLNLIVQSSERIMISSFGAPPFDCIVDCYIRIKVDNDAPISVKAYSMGNGTSDMITVNDKNVYDKIVRASKIVIGPSFIGENQSRAWEFESVGFDRSKMIKS